MPKNLQFNLFTFIHQLYIHSHIMFHSVMNLQYFLVVPTKNKLMYIFLIKNFIFLPAKHHNAQFAIL